MNLSKTATLTSFLLAAGVLAGTTAQAAEAGHDVVAPDAIKWVPNPTVPGGMTAVIMGDPKKPGAYIIRNKFPPNTTNAPHTHPDVRQVTVLSGTWNFGRGDTLDASKGTKLPAGTFFVEPAGSKHYNFTTNEEVIIQVSGNGPTASTLVK